MGRKDNFKFDKEGNFYRRVIGGNCETCDLNCTELCRTAKCITNGQRCNWKKDNELYTEFLKSKGLIEEKPIELEETQFDENGNIVKVEASTD